MMDEDEQLYSPDNTGKGQPGSVDDEEREQMTQQQALPLKFLTHGSDKTPKVGDVCKIKIDKIDGDMALVSYVKDQSEDEEEEEENENPPDEMSPEDELDQMGKEY